MSPFMTVQECAEYTRLAPTTLYQKVHKKEIPCVKHGRKLLFRRDEIEAWSAAQAKPVKVVSLSRFQQVKQKHLHGK